MREKELQRIRKNLEREPKYFQAKIELFKIQIFSHIVSQKKEGNRISSKALHSFMQCFFLSIAIVKDKPLTLSSITMHDALKRVLKAIKFQKRHEILTSIYFPPKFLSSFSPKYRQVILGFLGKKKIILHSTLFKGMVLSFSACIFLYLYPFMNLNCEYTKICKNLLKKKYIQYVNKRKGLGISYLMAFSLLCYFFFLRSVENKPLISEEKK